MIDSGQDSHRSPIIPQIGPSMLACDLSNLTMEAERMIASGADYLHLDVMDGHFVPNITFGAPVIKCLHNHTSSIFLDVHLMTSRPSNWVLDMKDAGADRLTFHIEVEEDCRSVINLIRENGMEVGIALRPSTPIETIFEYATMVDLVLIMTVEPGFGGQAFIESTISKIEILRQRFPNLNIEVDGGIGPSNIEKVAQAGANMIVAGSSIFKPKNRTSAEVITELRNSVIQANCHHHS